MTTTTTTALATDKQVGFIAKLLAEKDWSHFGEDTLSDALAMQAGTIIPRKHASQLIDALLACKKVAAPAPKPAAPAPTQAVSEGVYITPTDDIVKVKASKKGNNYALVAQDITGKRVTLAGTEVKFDFVYVPGIIRFITPDMRMTQEQAEQYAVVYGKCAWCGRKLKAAQSVKDGLGPVCIKRFA